MTRAIAYLASFGIGLALGLLAFLVSGSATALLSTVPAITAHALTSAHHRRMTRANPSGRRDAKFRHAIGR